PERLTVISSTDKNFFIVVTLFVLRCFILSLAVYPLMHYFMVKKVIYREISNDYFVYCQIN
ncbi:MAG: hypothetical protein ACOVRN_12210, partial [Flavobacterium sp.]